MDFPLKRLTFQCKKKAKEWLFPWIQIDLLTRKYPTTLMTSHDGRVLWNSLTFKMKSLCLLSQVQPPCQSLHPALPPTGLYFLMFAQFVVKILLPGEHLLKGLNCGHLTTGGGAGRKVSSFFLPLYDINIVYVWCMCLYSTNACSFRYSGLTVSCLARGKSLKAALEQLNNFDRHSPSFSPIAYLSL